MSDFTPAPQPLKILIANNHFTNYSGSEIHAIQLAEHYVATGAEVYLFGIFVKEQLRREIEARGIKFLTLGQVAGRKRGWFDIVWTHHETQFFLLHGLLGLQSRQAVHGILSVSARLERLPLLPRQTEMNLTLLANSVETRDRVQTLSGRQDIGVLLNIVPDAFGAHRKEQYPSALRRIAVVSNHVPEELIEAAGLLDAEGIEVSIFGRGHTYVLIDEHTLRGFDVVITIGKTAQYAIAQGIPLFLYDIFGGPGYVGPNDIDRHENYNYSGRSEPARLNASEIARALTEGYADAVQSAKTLSETHADRYLAGHQIERLLNAPAKGHAPLLGWKDRMQLVAATVVSRPSVVSRLLFPGFTEKTGKWLKGMRK